MAGRTTVLFLSLLIALAPPACEENVRPRSLVDQFKILAIEVDPPDVGLLNRNHAIHVTTLLVDPTGATGPVEYAVIACTNYDGVVGCLEEASVLDEADIEQQQLDLTEEEYRTFFSTFIARGRLEAHGRKNEFSTNITLPIELYGLMTAYGYTEVDARVYVLACYEGACPVMDDIDAFLAGDPAAPTGEELLYAISVPEALTAGAPMAQSALARKGYRILPQRTETSNDNPVIEGWELVGCDTLLSGNPETGRECSVQVSIDPEATLQVYEPSPDATLTAQEVAVIRFYATAGEMLPHTAQYFANGAIVQTSTLRLGAGEDPEFVDLYFVLIDSRGGLDYWPVAEAISR